MTKAQKVKEYKTMTYKGVNISGYVEHMNYHAIDNEGNLTDTIVEYDHEPQMQSWDLFGEFIEETTLLDLRDYPTIDSVKQYIDKKEMGV
jgi:hypothetical protein